MNLRPWTPAEDRVLLDQYGQTATLAEMAESLRRGRKAVWFRAKELGLTKSHPDTPTRVRQAALIMTLHGRGLLDSEIADDWTASHPDAPIDRRTVCDLRRRLQLPSNAHNERHRNQVRQRTKAQLAKSGVHSMADLRRQAYQQYVRDRGWPDYLRPRHSQILDLLYEHGPKTRLEIAEAIGWNVGRGQRTLLASKYGHGSYLADLVTVGLVIRSRYREVRGQSKGQSVFRYFIAPVIVRGDASTWPDKEWAHGQIYGAKSKHDSAGPAGSESNVGGRDLPA